MPKIHYIPKDKVLTESKEYSDPSSWNWKAPVALKPLKENHFICERTDNQAHYAIAKKMSSDIICGMDVDFVQGSDIGYPEFKDVPVVKSIFTVESERGKGFAKLLYETILNRHGILISSDELISDEGTINKSLGFWLNHLPKVGRVVNYDFDKKALLPFKLLESDKNMRFAVIKNLTEGITDKIKAAALATALGASSLSGATSDNISQHPKDFKAHYQQQQSDETPGIDIDIIAKIESSGNPEAVSNKGARGLCQIMPETWKDETRKMFGHSLPVEEMSNPELNKKVADHYYNVTIPKFLNAYDIPIEDSTILAAYNAGIGRVKNAYRKFGDKWELHMPQETKNYIAKYKNLTNSQ